MTGVAVSKATRSKKPSLRLTWTTPQSDVTISQYQVQYRKQGSSFWRKVNPVSPGSATSTLLEALEAGTVYEVRIRAVSAIGNGPWSRVESEVTYMSELSSELKHSGCERLECVLKLICTCSGYPSTTEVLFAVQVTTEMYIHVNQHE